MIRRGEVWWVDFGVPRGSSPARRRPAVVLQVNPFNDSRIATVVVVAVTSNLRAGDAPGNVVLPAGTAGLTQASAINVSQLGMLDKSALLQRIGTLPAEKMVQVEAGVRLILGL